MVADWEWSSAILNHEPLLLNNCTKCNAEKVTVCVCVSVWGWGCVRWSVAIKRYGLVLLYKHIVDTHMSGVDHNMLGQMAVEALNIQHYRPGLHAAAADDKIHNQELRFICTRCPGEYSQVCTSSNQQGGNRHQTILCINKNLLHVWASLLILTKVWNWRLLRQKKKKKKPKVSSPC